MGRPGYALVLEDEYPEKQYIDRLHIRCRPGFLDPQSFERVFLSCVGRCETWIISICTDYTIISLLTPPYPGLVAMPTVYVTRKTHFNAAHRLHNPSKSDEWNREIFGQCNNPNWHGHNYELEVTVAGEPDPDTGYVIDLGVFKKGD